MLLFLACSPVTPELPTDSGEPTVDSSGSLDSVEVLPPDTAGPVVDDGGPPYDHLPVLVIDAAGAIGDGVKTDATLQVIARHDGTLTDLDTAERQYAGAIGIELHGSSSLGYPKLPYKFECRDEVGEDTNCALLGLPAASDWVLHAPYSDKTYMRNALAYALGAEAAAESGRWEPHTRFVEVFLDREYIGIYVLVERVSRESGRLNIPRTTDPVDGSVDGGFIVKVDQHRSVGFDTARGTPIDWAEPKSGEVTEAEAAYLREWFDTMETSLASDTFADQYPAYLDVDAWVDHWLLNEIAHNIDAYRLSAYLWADGPPGVGLLRAGPLWDFDRAFGDVNYCNSWTTDGWIYDSLADCGYAYQYPFWWERLREDPAFLQKLRDRWDTLRAGPLADSEIRSRIAEMKAELAEAEVRDQAKWHTVGTSVDPNWYVGETWDDEIDWLTNWVIERAAWMDVHVGE